jgi:hypothetical protein
VFKPQKFTTVSASIGFFVSDDSDARVLRRRRLLSQLSSSVVTASSTTLLPKRLITTKPFQVKNNWVPVPLKTATKVEATYRYGPVQYS